MVLGWRAFHPEFRAPRLAAILVYYMREVRDPKVPDFIVSDASIWTILRDASYVYKASRPYHAVIFTEHTAIACVNYSHTFVRLNELSGAREHFKRLYFADEPTFNIESVPAMTWEKKDFLQDRSMETRRVGYRY